MLEVRIPQLVPPSPNATRREHWSKGHRRVKKERAAVALVLGPARIWASPLLAVTLVRCAPRRLDSDNLVASMKAVRDEVAAWLGIDDGDARVEWRVEQRKATRAQQGTIVRVEARG